MSTILDTLKAERAKYPDRLTPAQAIELLDKAAYAHRDEGWGLLAKPAGNRWDGRSVDYLFNRTTGLHHDVLEDAPDASTKPVYLGTSKPYLGTGKPMDVSRWLAPRGSAPAPDPEPTPEPPKPPTDDRIDRILAWLDVHAKVQAAQVEQLKGIAQQLSEIAAKQPPPVAFPAYVGALGMRMRFTPEEPQK